jgi:hypothetical protein
VKAKKQGKKEKTKEELRRRRRKTRRKRRRRRRWRKYIFLQRSASLAIFCMFNLPSVESWP